MTLILIATGHFLGLTFNIYIEPYIEVIWVQVYTYPKESRPAMGNGPGLTMYFLLKMGDIPLLY